MRPKTRSYPAATHHKGDSLAGLRLSADHEDAAAEHEETQSQQGQDPHLHVEDAVDVVGGEIAHHTHQQHCDWKDTFNPHIFKDSIRKDEPGVLTQEADAHVDHTGGVFGGGGRRVKNSLKGGAAIL